MTMSTPFSLKEAKSEGLILDKKKKKLYGAMWFDGKLNPLFNDVMIRWPDWRGKKSMNSYQFCCADGIEVDDLSNDIDKIDATRKLLKKIFLKGSNKEINEYPDIFDNKFMQACGGSGKEYLKIAKMHSSSLCALLFFYGVSEGKNLTLELNGKDYVFYESVFEYKSPVFDKMSPSNMDVVLLGNNKDNKNEKVVLFLESKFSEYIDHQKKYGKNKNKKTGKNKGISKEYLSNNSSKEIYHKESLEKIGLERKSVINGEYNDTDDFELCATCSKDLFYIQGIKQMISHYVGVKKVLSSLRDEKKGDLIVDNKKISDEQNSQKRVNDSLDKDTKIILGEILFDLPGFEEEENRYSKKYKKLATIINEINEDDPRFEMLFEPLSYSLFKSNTYILDKNVKEYYGFK